MEGYGQFCPVSLAAEVVARRWTPLILRELLEGSRRFNDLRRGLPRIGASTLSRRLAELRSAGIVEVREGPGGREYHLTPAGEELRPVIEQLGVWGRRWMPTHYRAEDLDPRLLMWDIHRRIDRSEIGERLVLAFHFRDAPDGMRNFWLVVGREDADVCLTDPGFGTDLHLLTDVRSLVEVWMGDGELAVALRDRRIELHGPEHLRRRLPEWLTLSPFAAVAPAGEAPAAARR